MTNKMAKLADGELPAISAMADLVNNGKISFWEVAASSSPPLTRKKTWKTRGSANEIAAAFKKFDPHHDRNISSPEVKNGLKLLDASSPTRRLTSSLLWLTWRATARSAMPSSRRMVANTSQGWN